MKKILLVTCLFIIMNSNALALLNTELVVNGNAETGDTTGWVSTGIDAVTPDAPAQGFGLFSFTGNTGPVTQTLLQTINVSDNSTQIDSGQIQSVFSINLQSRTGSSTTDLARVDVSYINISGSVLDTFSIIDNVGVTAGNWKFFKEIKFLPTGTKSIEILLTANRSGGISSDGFFDEVSLQLNEVENSVPTTNDDISGIWISDDYQCPVGVENTEKIKIEKNNSVFTAIKLEGDDCIPSGYVTFFWDTSKNICKAIGTSAPFSPTSVFIDCQVNVIDEQNFSVILGNTSAEGSLAFRKFSEVPAVTIAPGFDIHIPNVDFTSSNITNNLWVDLKFVPTENGELLWQLEDYGVNP